MSRIYIPMEMPTSCYDCPIECEGDICGIDKGGCTWDERPPHCPLVPVPKHGDLVDKQQMAETNEQHYKVVEGEPEADYARKVVLRMLDQAPTIIPADKEGEG